MPTASQLQSQQPSGANRQTPKVRGGCFSWAILGLALLFIPLIAITVVASDDMVSKTTDVEAPVCGAWDVTSGPGMGSWDSRLQVVGGTSNNLWALGSRKIGLPPWFTLGFVIPVGGTHLYAAHWDGKTWDVFNLAGIGNAHKHSLYAMHAPADDDIWAVGQLYTGSDYRGSQTLAIHWDGRNWSRVSTPNNSTEWNELRDVAVIAANDAWSVGDSGAPEPLILHWDGTDWKIDQNPSLGQLPDYVRLFGVAGTSSKDVWVVGNYAVWINEPGSDKPTQDWRPFSAHWDGNSWTSVPMPALSYTTLLDVVAIAPDDVWAVGTDAVTLHWNGKEWQQISNPAGWSSLEAVVAASSSSVWAAGHNGYGGGSVVIHWDGKNWNQVDIRMPYARQAIYNAALVSPQELWTVGGTHASQEYGPWYSMAGRFAETPCASSGSK